MTPESDMFGKYWGGRDNVNKASSFCLCSLSPDASPTTSDFLGYELIQSREVEPRVDQRRSPVSPLMAEIVMVCSKHDVLNRIRKD